MGQEDHQPLDLERIFLGDDFALLFLVEILFRTFFMYVSALLLVRFIGKRGLGQLSPFEFLVVIAMGSAAGDPMFYPEIPLINGVLVLAGVVFLEKTLIMLSGRNQKLEHFIESVPALLVQDGAVIEDHIREEGLARDELMMKLRERGIANLAEVHLAYLEPSGALSIFRVEDRPRREDGESTLPEVPARGENPA